MDPEESEIYYNDSEKQNYVDHPWDKNWRIWFMNDYCAIDQNTVVNHNV